MKKMSTKKIYILYGFLLFMVAVSYVFTNVSYDAEYQMAMAYRMIKGDRMIVEMWEPHQTSAFLCAALMKLYMTMTGTTTGIVLFLQVIGLLIRCVISGLLYRAFKAVGGEKPALIGAALYFLISPKDLLIPEFSNMQLWFATLMFLCFAEYYSKKQLRYLMGAAVSFCLGVFSYPSFIMAYAAAFVIIISYSERKGRDFTLFTAICAVIGGGFAAYFLWKLGLKTILECVTLALSLEPSHTGSFLTKATGFLGNIIEVAVVIFLIFGIGFILEKGIRLIYSKRKRTEEVFSKNRWFILSVYVLLFFVLLNVISAQNRSWYSIIWIVLCGFAFLKRKVLSAEEKRIYYIALWIGMMNILCTLVLSDHPFLPSVPYMLNGICASVIPLYRWYQREMKDRADLKKMFIYGVHACLLVLIIRGVFLHVSMYGRGQTCSLLSDLALIRSGPAIGIITDEEGAARQRDSMAEWKQYIKKGDTIWLLGEPVDTMGYLYEDVEVGAPTVMSTPTYNESLLYYWEMNPDKYPDVVILSSSFGELSWELLKNEWLLNWLENEYCAEYVIDGNYWRYYFKENR